MKSASLCVAVAAAADVVVGQVQAANLERGETWRLISAPLLALFPRRVSASLAEPQYDAVRV
jgi:hypothetical protein